MADAAKHRWLALFDRFPFGLLLVDRRGQVLRLNERSAEILSIERDSARRAGMRCCDLICDRTAFGVDGECLTRRALDDEPPTPTEIDIALDSEGSTASACAIAAGVRGEQAREQAYVLFHLRPEVSDRAGDGIPAPASAPKLRIRALGSLRLETEAGPIEAEWLERRPGELLKYLVCERSRSVASEQIAEALWPNAGLREALACVRQYVHQLRAGLEPDRDRRSPSSYVATRRGGYALGGVWIDADEFEQRAERGLSAAARADHETGRLELLAACDLYRGHFLADDPYADWALAERDRLRDLASRGLRALIAIELEDGLLDAAWRHARKLAEMEPFDIDVHRQFLSICLRLGRRGDAARRYALLRERLRHSFGEDPGFTLADLRASAHALA